MKRFRSILLTVILTLALCFSVVACNGAGATKYTLSFEMNGHGAQVAEQVLREDESPSRPEDPTEEGWRFDGWYIDAEFVEPYGFDSIDEDTKVYAKWTQVFTVSFDTGEGGITVDCQTVAVGEKVNLPAGELTAPGKKFEGWYMDATLAAPFDENDPITQDVTLYAKWSSYFKVTFDRNGRGQTAKTPKPQEYTAEGSKAVRPDDMEATSFKFLGWSTEVNGKDNIYDFDTVLTDSITLYAQWVRVYSVSFSLNHEEALQQAPESLYVDDGCYALRPEIDPVISGYVFMGWYTKAEGGEKFDFENTPITATTVIYAQWEKQVGKVDVIDVDLPNYSYREEAAYGERPDLDGFIIDGKMGEKEKWEEQNWYSTGITEAPTVSYKISTRFSPKGLYVFFSVTDNGGLYHDGRNYYFKNSHLEFRIYDGSSNVCIYRMDTETLYPGSNRVKIAVNIAEGKVNTVDSQNKKAVMNVEMFATWEDLDIKNVPNKVKIHTMYKYKRIAFENINYTLMQPFANKTMVIPNDYVEFDTNGYVHYDAENAVLGESSYGIAKTSGWDVSHESDENDAYVSSDGFNTQAIFYKGIRDSEYYLFEYELDGSRYTNSGKAGAIIYNSDINYALMVFSVDPTTYNKTTNTFIKAKPSIKITDKNGALITKDLATVDVSATGKIQVKMIFSNGYVFWVLNGVLIHCEFISDLNVRTNPGLCTVEGGEGVRFKNYYARLLTEEEAAHETGKYAYVISQGRLRGITVNLSAMGVSSVEGASKEIVMNIKHGTVTITNSQKEKIRNDRVIDSNITIDQLESFIFTVGGEAHDIINEIDDPEKGLKYGEFTYNYAFKGDAVITNTLSTIDSENITAIIGRVVDNNTGDPVAATATIMSDNPRLSCYDMRITGGDMVLIVPKGFNYKIAISQTGYRTIILDNLNGINDITEVPEIRLVPNILGGVAQSRKSKLSYTSTLSSSSTTYWDMSDESNGIIVFETNKASTPDVFFSGYTIHNYQYAKLSVSNVTDVESHTVYEKDPSIGFRIINEGKAAFIGLRQTGLRYISGNAGDPWAQIGGYGKATCDFIDPTGNHKDTLEILRIDRMLYSWINGTYMGCIELAPEFEREAAIGVFGTFGGYGRIIYRDYEIKVGDEAVEIAKEKVGFNLALSDSVYDYNEDWTGRDYNKPLIKISGLSNISYDDGSEEEVALAGKTITVSRTEFASDGEIMKVSVGSFATIVLSKDVSSQTVTFPNTVNGNVSVSVLRERSSIISGKFVGNVEHEGLKGYVELNDGNKFDFTTGSDGSFSIYVPVDTTVIVRLDTVGYIAPEIITRSLRNAGAVKNIDDIELYKTQFGGIIKGTAYDTSIPYGKFKAGYDTSAETVYEGEYLEVEATLSNQLITINTGTFVNFDVSFSLIRFKYEDRENESDPAFGLQVLSPNGADQILFHKDGVRSYPAGRNMVLKHGIMKYSTATSYNVPVEFRIIKRYSMYFMYYRLDTTAEWELIQIVETNLSGAVALRFDSSTSKALHYIVWNFKAVSLTSENTPQDLYSSVNVVNKNEEMGTVSLSGGTEIDGKVEYVYGDYVTLTLRSNAGYMPAYAKINGEFAVIENNKIQFLVNEKVFNIEVGFEKYFETYPITGKITVDTTYKDFKMPSSVNIVAYMQDGRSYESKNVPITSDGSVAIQLREGTFKIYAYSSTLASLEKDITVSKDNRTFGTLTLCNMRSGNVVVNGTTLITENAMGEELLYKNGMLTLPVAKSSNCWLPEAVVKGDFVYSVDVIQSGSEDSPYYSNDEVCGFIFSNGVRTFSIQFWGNGFRISGWAYNIGAMLWPQIANQPIYFGSLPAGVEKVNNLAVKRLGEDLYVYANGRHVFTLSNKEGFVWANGVTGKDGFPDAESAAMEVYSSVMTGTEKELAIGYHCNLGKADGSCTNQAGFYNVKFTDKAELVKAFNGRF
ncbi:MAG: InlB B-repeat-containing protein [Clostridia bacterium]|nr:InlB B-repeat-containing protein [Clostridia bacterium]